MVGRSMVWVTLAAMVFLAPQSAAAQRLRAPGFIVRAELPPTFDHQHLGGPYYRVWDPAAAWVGRGRVWREGVRRVNLDVDPLEQLQWYLTAGTDVSAVWPQHQSSVHVGADAAWAVTLGDPAVVVAVLDTGSPLDHPDLPASQRAGGRDVIDDDDDPEPIGVSSEDAHGTAVAGLAVGARNDVGMTGVCPDCSFLPIRLLANDPLVRDGDLVEGLMWAAQNADIINASWSFDPFAYVPPSVHDALQWAADNGRGGLGTVVVFSSGNRTQLIEPFTPQARNDVITVGATDERDVFAAYSNFGPSLDLVAPGGLDDGFSNGERVPRAKLVTADLEGDAGNNPTIDSLFVPGVVDDLAATATFRGTSASAPLVAGAAGLILSINPNLTAREVQWILTESANPVGDDHDSTGFSQRYGHGRLDVGAAVAMAQSGAHCSEVPEDCANAMDDDCDRKVDEEDVDCGAPGARAFEAFLGDSCSSSATCGDGLCLGPDGSEQIRYCSAFCDFDCPEGGLCVGSPGTGRCLAPCDGGACPAGFGCGTPAESLLPPALVGSSACLPVCNVDEDCSGALCWDGLCRGAVAPPANPNSSGCVAAGHSFIGGVLGWVGLWRRRRHSQPHA